MKMVLLALIVITSVHAYSKCRVKIDTTSTKLSSQTSLKLHDILSSKGYLTSFDSAPDLILQLIDISQGNYTSDEILYGIDARLLSVSGGLISRGTSVNVSPDENYVIQGDWINQSTLEAINNINDCK